MKWKRGHRLILRRHKSILEKDLEPKDVLSKLTTVLDQNDEDEINHLASCLIEAGNEEKSNRSSAPRVQSIN